MYARTLILARVWSYEHQYHMHMHVYLGSYNYDPTGIFYLLKAAPRSH